MSGDDSARAGATSPSSSTATTATSRRASRSTRSNGRSSTSGTGRSTSPVCAATRRSSTSDAATACTSGCCATRGHRGLVCGADLSAGMLQQRAARLRRRPVARERRAGAAVRRRLVRRHARDAHAVPRARSRARDRRAPARAAAGRCRARASPTPTRTSSELDDLLVECARPPSARVERVRVRRSHPLQDGERRAGARGGVRSVTAHDFRERARDRRGRAGVDYARSMATFVADTDARAATPVLRRAATAGSPRRSRPTARSGSRPPCGCFVCR